MKKFGEYLEESLAAEIKSEPKTAAAKQAKKMGLAYVGFGRYADNKGRVAYVVDNDRLVPFKGQQDAAKLYDKADMTNNPEKSREMLSQANQISKTHNKRTKEDRKILSQKDKDVTKVAKQLSSLYRPEMFDEAELQAIEAYTGDAYADINRYLYKGHDEGIDANMADEIGRMINDLDSAFDGTQAPFPFTVYSGLSGRYKASKIQAGQEYVFRGYISTSLSHDVSISGFTDSPEPVVLQIEINKGAKAIYVDGISAVDGELETLLPRGSKVKIISGPHPLPKSVVGMNFDEDDQSAIQLFHCKLVQDV